MSSAFWARTIAFANVFVKIVGLNAVTYDKQK
jgi:hypothetical protein